MDAKDLFELASCVVTVIGLPFGFGAIDAEGFTQWVERGPGEALSFDLAKPGQP